MTFSPAAPASGLAPVSTLMPEMTPWPASTSTKGAPSEACWRIVSSNRMTPEMNSLAPGVVNSSSRYARRLSSVDSTLIAANRFSIVPALSSAARNALAGRDQGVGGGFQLSCGHGVGIL